MIFGIVAALDEEVEMLHKQMTDARIERLGGHSYHIGNIHGCRAVAVRSSVGKVNASVCSTMLIEHFHVGCVINVGIAGAVDPRLNVLDVTISTCAVFHDTDPIMTRYYPFTQEFRADDRLIRRCVNACQEMTGRPFNYYLGTIASGDVFVNDPQVKNAIVKRFHPLCVEMEGAAVAQTAAMFHIPFLIIRTMSDNANENAEQSYENLLTRAAQNTEEIILRMLNHYHEGE